MMMLRRIMREPLMHFALAGLLIFLFYYIQSPEKHIDATNDMSITVTAAQINQLADQFTRINMRPPTDNEISALIENHIHEEVMYREALAMQLDKNDAQVRNRLKMKLEYLLEDIASPEISDSMLHTFLNENKEHYRTDVVVTFEQIFINPEKHKNPTNVAIVQLSAVLQGTEAAVLGDTTLLNKYYKNVTESTLNGYLGKDFTQQLLQQPLQIWSGPIKSEFGLHLVKISQLHPAQTPSVEQIRSVLIRDFDNQRKRQNKQNIYQVLRDKYNISIAADNAQLVAN